MACNDINSSCTDSCDQIDGLFEAASNLVQYRDIIEKWLHGKQNETVQIGGEVVKTLLGLIADIKQLVGVLPDGKTIILDDTRKVLSVLLDPDGGIKVKAEGGLYVDVEDILVLGGGLAKDEDGRIYVDFSQMPTDKFEALLKSIRVPIWLTANKNFYVNGEMGSDTLDEGRGESEEKPFKTIQACVNYVCDNYNLSRYVSRMIIEGGEYEPFEIGSFSSTTGYLSLEPKNKATINVDFSDKNTKNTYGINITSNGRVDIKNFLINVNVKNETENRINADVFGIVLKKGTSYLKNIEINISNSGKKNIRKLSCVACTENGYLYISDNSVLNSSVDTGVQAASCMNTATGGTIGLPNDYTEDPKWLKISGNYSIIMECAGGNFSRAGTTMPTIVDGGTTGKRFVVQNGGHINTNGGGPDFFPGDTPGTVEASTYSWYK